MTIKQGPDEPTEYYRGLVFYLLGAIKFKNLEAIPNARKIVFLAAGTIAGRLDRTSIAW